MPLFAPTSFASAVTPITSYPLTPLPPKEKDENLRKISPLLRSSKPVPASLLAVLKEARKTARTLSFFLYPEHPSLVGCSSCTHQDRPVVEKLSRSREVGPQTLGAQCGTYFGADEEVRSVVNVCLAAWA